MTTDPGTSAEVPGSGRAWVRPVALVVSCLVIGFVGGWILRGDEGPVTTLAPAPSAGASSGAVPAAGSGRTSAPARVTPPPPAPDRSVISLAVLNGTPTAGLAAKTAGQAESLGYSGVTTGNAPTSSNPTIAYFHPGRRPAAERVARDLQISRVEALPRTGAVAAGAPKGADVVIVLGPG